MAQLNKNLHIQNKLLNGYVHNKETEIPVTYKSAKAKL